MDDLNLFMTVFLFFGGLILGSFLNTLIHRLPRNESVVFSRSCCPLCGRLLGCMDLVPLISFWWLKGKCRYCGQPISWRYPVVELLSGFLTVLWGIRFYKVRGGLVFLILTYALIVIAFIDLEHKIIPNRLTVPLLLIGLVFKTWEGELPAAITGCIIGGGILLLVAILYPKGMGMGDVKLLAMLGVFLGWVKVILLLFLASFLATGIISVLILLKKAKRRDPIPFGTFLSGAAIFLVLVNNIIELFKIWTTVH